MRLTTPQNVLSAMGVVENPGSIANVTRSVELATTVLEGALETSFGLTRVTDFFDVLVGDNFFRLTNMFVNASSIAVRMSVDGEPLLTAKDGELLTASAYRQNPEKGIITLLQAQRSSPLSVSVTYDSGFDTGDDNLTLDCPAWLEDCAVAIAVQAQNILPSSPANRKDKSVQSVVQELRSLCSYLINPRLRPRLYVSFPVHSIVESYGG